MQIKRGSFKDPKDQRFFRHFDFDTDMEIPVVLVFPVREIQEGKSEPNDFELLLLKRSQKVGAYQGMWCPIAGVDDHVVDGSKDSIKGSIATVIDELTEEACIPASASEINFICGTRHPCLKKEGRTWVQRLFLVKTEQEKISLNEESDDFIWISVKAIAEYVLTGKTNDTNLMRIFSDGTPLSVDDNLDRFVEYFLSKFRLPDFDDVKIQAFVELGYEKNGI